MVYSSRKEFVPIGENSFLKEVVSLGRGAKKGKIKSRIASSESIPIHINSIYYKYAVLQGQGVGGGVVKMINVVCKNIYEKHEHISSLNKKHILQQSPKFKYL